MSEKQPTIIVNAPSSQALPALINFFCWPGLGQLIQGRIFAALFWWCVYLAAFAMILSVGLAPIGFILLPIAWILCVIDAAKYSPSASRTPASRAVSLVIAAAAFIVFAPMVYVAVTRTLSEPPKLAPIPMVENKPGPPVMPPSIIEQPVEQPPLETVSPEPEPETTTTTEPAESPESTPTEPEVIYPSKLTGLRDMRTWTSATGTFTVDAKFAGYRAGKVMLQKDDGKIINVEWEKLSTEDREWLDARSPRPK